MSTLFTLNADMQGIAAAHQHLASLPDVLDAGLGLGIFQASLLLQREVAERTPATAGTLRNSILAAMPERKGGAVLGVVGSPLAYAEPVELGTKPHMPPVQPLVDWVEIKLGLKGKDARTAAWAIARSIAKKGTKGAFMFRDALDANRDQIDRIVKGAMSAALEAHRQEGAS